MKKYQNLRIISFSLIFMAVLIFFGLNHAQPGKKRKGKPTPPPLELGVINLATQDFSDMLRVWTRPGGLSPADTGFVEQWSKEKCDYDSLEFGDANNDGKNDLVVSGYIEKRKKKQIVYYSHFEVYETNQII